MVSGTSVSRLNNQESLSFLSFEMLNTELPAKVGDGIAYRHSCLSNTQAERLDSLSKRLVQNNGMLLNDSPTFITPSAAQFDLIYDDLLDVCNKLDTKGLWLT